MTTLLFHTFPTHVTLLSQMAAVDPDPHTMAGYHPLIADRLTGEQMTHLGVVTAFLLAQADYIGHSGLPGSMADVLAMSAHQLMEAIIDDPDFLSAVVSRWNEVAG